MRSDRAPQGILVTASMLPKVKANLFMHKKHYPHGYQIERRCILSDTAVQEHQAAPDFTLPAVGNDDIVKNGQVHLADLKRHTVVSIVHFSHLRIAHVP